jgi:hypothetical protein
MTDDASPDARSENIDDFDREYRRERRLHAAWLATISAACSLVCGGFGYLTDLDSMRWLAFGLAGLAIPLIVLAIRVMGQEGSDAKNAVVSGTVTTGGAWGIALIVLFVPGLRVGIPYKLTGADAMITTADDRATYEKTQDSEADFILGLIEEMRSNPSAATLRSLLPYLERDATDILLDGQVRNVSSAVREVIQKDKDLYLRSLHEEAEAMAALMPAAGVVPEIVHVEVPKRMKYALNNLIAALSEKKIKYSFDVPSVRFNIKVAVFDEEGNPKLDDNGQPVISNRELGIMYPYDNFYGGDLVFADPTTVPKILDAIRKELEY